MRGRNWILYLAFVCISLIGFMHQVASRLYLYWTNWWFDYLMHFLAGFGGALAAIWFLEGTRYKNWFTVLGSVLVFAVAWEVFEYIFGLTASTESYALDTFHDLVIAMVGAVIGGTITSRSRGSF